MAFDFKPKRPAFDFKPRQQADNGISPQRDIEIYVGIDFGTTFSKVSFQVGDKEGTTKYSIRFARNGREEDYCLPSVLGYDQKERCLVFNQHPEQKDGLTPVRYFKYSMIEKGVPRDIADLEEGGAVNDPQRICSAFYLGHLLRIVKKTILDHDAVKGRYRSIRWYVNMGVPISDFTAKPKPIYDEALNVAWQLSELDNLDKSCQIDFLDKFYNRWVSHLTWSDRLNTVPELYAEIIMFLQAKTTGSGFYGVIDIGGGTVDLAIFKKRIDLYKQEPEIYCVSQDVCPLGYEMYTRFLERGNADRRLGTSYAECLEKARNNHRREMSRLFGEKRRVQHFYMGGARNVPFYHNIINATDGRYVDAWIGYPGCEEKSILNFMKGMFNLEVSDNPRLVISQMLAQPFEKMPQLTGQEWNKGVEKLRPAPRLEELQDHLYGR